jgi:hypothetical protein
MKRSLINCQRSSAFTAREALDVIAKKIGSEDQHLVQAIRQALTELEQEAKNNLAVSLLLNQEVASVGDFTR